MSSTTPPLIWVDLIEDEPISREGFFHAHPGEDISDIAIAYAKYRDGFQPWRSLIKSGDNEEPLFRSTERYFNKADAIHAIQLAFGPETDVYLRQHEQGNQVLRLATQTGD